MYVIHLLVSSKINTYYEFYENKLVYHHHHDDDDEQTY